MLRSVLVLDTELLPAALTALTLSRVSREVTVSTAGNQATAVALATHPELILLRLDLRNRGSQRLLPRLRAGGVQVPVLALAEGVTSEQAELLCAEGYAGIVAHPFEALSLIRQWREQDGHERLAHAHFSTAHAIAPDTHSRVGTGLQPHAGAPPRAGYTYGQLAVEPAARAVAVSGRDVRLSFREYELLLYLCERAGQAVSRGELALHLYGRQLRPRSRAIAMLINSLRRRLGISADAAGYIQSVHRFGFRLATHPKAIGAGERADSESGGAARRAQSASNVAERSE